jgi:hypothetical protein
MATLRAIAPVNTGGRWQQSSATQIAAIVPSDVTPVGPCAQIITTVGGNLSLGMWDGTTVVIATVAGEVIFISPKLVKAATTGTYFAAY